MKQKLLFVLVLLTAAFTGARAQGDVTVNGSGNAYNITMPAFDVEVTTELWYKLAQSADNSAIYTKLGTSTPVDVYLERSLQSGGWNTFCAPFAITVDGMNEVFGTGNWTLKALSSSAWDEGNKTLTLNFTDATEVAAATPYLLKLTTAVDLSAVGKEFEDVTLVTTPVNVETTYADFIPTLSPVAMTSGDKSILFISNGSKLAFPNTDGSLGAFRAYFKLKGALAGARAFSMYFGNGEQTTGIIDVTNTNGTNETNMVYDLQGRKVQNATTKGVYIVNGKKLIIK